MPKLVVLADDFTGSLDTGVQFAKLGISTSVLFSDCDSAKIATCPSLLMVIDLESRHDTAEDAYNKVYKTVCEVLKAGVKNIYKKTDSALRGNIGAELTALLDASKASLLEFVPAFPQNGRTTQNGIHYVSGVPVAESVFGSDPFNPVKHSYIPDIIAEQSKVPVSLGDKLDKPFIRVHNAQTEEDLKRIAEKMENVSITAGCAAFAKYLPELLKLNADRKDSAARTHSKKMLLISGSVNEITLRQIEEAKKQYRIFSVTSSADEISAECEEKGLAIVASAEIDNKPDFSCSSADTIENIRVEMANRIARRTRELFVQLCPDTVTVFGGDTLLAVIRELGCIEITPINEISSGTVLCRAKTAGREFLLVTKSGGFGSPEIVREIVEYLK